MLRALVAMELKSYNAILAPPIYQKSRATVELKSYNAILAPQIYQKRLAVVEANL